MKRAAAVLCLALSACAAAPVYLAPLMDAERMSWRADILILDVRSDEEFAAGHIAGALNIPAVDLIVRADELPLDKASPVLIYSESGRVANWAAEQLTQLGYRRVHNIDGGYRAWRDAGFGFVTGPDEDWRHPY